jgi:hypothetical protein
MVPVVVIGPPVSPDPVLTWVTVPVPAPVVLIVMFPVDPVREIPVPPVNESTPVLFRVIVPEVPPPDKPVPAITPVMPPEVPLAAAVIRPYWSTVIFVLV